MKSFMRVMMIVLGVSVLAGVNADASVWKKSLDIGITLNHAKSKVNPTGTMTVKQNVTVGFLLDGEMIKDTPEINWKNTLELDYARSKTSESTGAVLSAGDWVEDIDQLVLDSVHSWKKSRYSTYAAVNIQTSILDSSAQDDWEAFNPVQFRESFGASLAFTDREDERFSGRLGLFYQHYWNEPDGSYYDNSSGLELVFDYRKDYSSGALAKSKLGFYADLTETAAPWDPAIETKKVKLEWDNVYSAPLNDYLKLRFSLNIDNIDITESITHYEWEEKVVLVFNYKII